MHIIRIMQKYRIILSHHQKIRVIELVILMIIAGFLEMMSVSLIVPFMDAVMNLEETMDKWYVKLVCNLFGISSHRGFLAFLGIFLALLYIFKNLFLLFQMMIQKKFVYNNMFAAQEKLLEKFLNRPYEFFLKVNSAEVLRIIGNDTAGAFSLLTILLGMFSEIVVSVILIGTVFFIAPEMTAGVAALLLILLLIIMKVVRPILAREGKNYQNALAGLNKWLLQSIEGIKEIKIMRKEKYFKENYSINGWNLMKAQYRNETLSVFPRYMIEGISMSSIFIVISVMVSNGTELQSIIPMLSSVAVASIRLLPSVNRISQNIAAITYQEPMLDKMIANMNDVDSYRSVTREKGEERKIKTFEREIVMKGISYQYPTGDKLVLNDADMKIEKGLSIGIVGPSGSGKTTSVDLLLGLLKPFNGGVYIDGINIEDDMEGWLSQVGYIPQNIFMLDGSLSENVAFGVTKDEIDESRVWGALRNASLEEFVSSLPEGIHTQMGERGIRLSGGQRQRIGIARALYKDPAILFFDEATSALDNKTEGEIMRSIENLKRSKTIIIIAHRLTTIENCDRVFRVEAGKIFEDRNVGRD